ncbi:hypothetical protein FKM82_021183 [Ascaphus truei]
MLSWKKISTGASFILLWFDVSTASDTKLDSLIPVSSAKSLRSYGSRTLTTIASDLVRANLGSSFFWTNLPVQSIVPKL